MPRSHLWVYKLGGGGALGEGLREEFLALCFGKKNRASSEAFDHFTQRVLRGGKLKGGGRPEIAFRYVNSLFLGVYEGLTSERFKRREGAFQRKKRYRENRQRLQGKSSLAWRPPIRSLEKKRGLGI